MLTYSLLSAPFLFFAVIVFVLSRPTKMQLKCAIVVGVILLVLTLVFDNLIIASGIVDYDHSKNLGIIFGLAPLEDFYYMVFAVLVTLGIWGRYEKS